MLGQSCKDDEANTAPVPERLKLELDLEDHLYKFEGQWYRWDDEIVNCEPAFHAEYVYDVESLRITFCEVLGTISHTNYAFIDENCSLNISEFLDRQAGEGLTVIDIQTDMIFFTCIHEESDWIEFEFDFFYK